MKLIVALYAFFVLLAAGALFALMVVAQFPAAVSPDRFSSMDLACLALFLAGSGLLSMFWLSNAAGRPGVVQRMPGVYQPTAGQPGAIQPAVPYNPGAAAFASDQMPAGHTEAVHQVLQGQMSVTLSEPALAQVLDLLARQRKIEAIKVVREDTGLGLKEAKDIVDWMEVNIGRK